MAGFGWTVWTAIVAVGIFATVAVAAVTWRRWVPSGRPSRVPLAMFVGIAVLAGGTAVATWHESRATTGPDDRLAVARRATEISELLTTVTPQSHDEILDRLRPLVVDGMAELIKAEVLDAISPDATRTGTVHAVGVPQIGDDTARVITVIEQMPPRPDRNEDGEPSSLILVLSMIRHDGQWKLKAVAPATV